LGEIRWGSFDFDRYRDALDQAAQHGPIYSAAYVIPPPRLGEGSKRVDHLRLLERIIRDGLPSFIADNEGLESVYLRLRSYPSLGRFLAFQFAVDLNYSPVMNASEDEFVVAGPTQQSHFARLGLRFPGLFGRRLQLVDCQNLFCEIDKYARVAHPSARGISGRSRIKQKFRPLAAPLSAVFPPKWRLTAVPYVGTPSTNQLPLFGSPSSETKRRSPA
jgi:hypothetical protein